MTKKNKLNDLSGKDWIKNSISWFHVDTPQRNEKQLQHPAKYPSSLAGRFINFFTQKGEWVIDPFAGTGSTLLASWQLERNAIGIELNPDYATQANNYLEQSSLDTWFDDDPVDYTQKVLIGDSSNIDQILEQNFPDQEIKFNLCMTSPPYWNMLNKSRGGSNSQHKERIEKDLPLKYSEKGQDLGNIDDYDTFIEKLVDIFNKIKPFMKTNAYLIVVLQNIRDENQQFRPLAWDFAREMSKYFKVEQEQIWCQTDKTAGIWGFPTTYVSNVHHHYCLIFRNIAD